MFKIIVVLFLLNSFLSASSFSQSKKIEKNGMVVRWELSKDHIRIEMSAPTNGWVAIGLNETDQLQGTNLVMGSVNEGKVKMSDRFILKPGVHKAMEELSAKSLLENCSGEESQNSTRISFRIPLKSPDNYHKNLIPGASYTLLVAYSREDDFMHHSMMRSSVTIIL